MSADDNLSRATRVLIGWSRYVVQETEASGISLMKSLNPANSRSMEIVERLWRDAYCTEVGAVCAGWDGRSECGARLRWIPRLRSKGQWRQGPRLSQSDIEQWASNLDGCKS
jgi:hypothetical protein